MTVSKEKKEASECYTCGGMGTVLNAIGNQHKLVECPDCQVLRKRITEAQEAAQWDYIQGEDPGDLCDSCHTHK